MRATLLAVALLASACTTLSPSGDPGPKMLQDGGGGNSDGGGNPAGSKCPCAKGNYCDLATQTCKPGCAQESDCLSTQTCDLATRTCKALPLNDMGMVIGAACAKLASFMNTGSGDCSNCFISQCGSGLQPCFGEVQPCVQKCMPDGGTPSLVDGCECVRSCLSSMCRTPWDTAMGCVATSCVAECK